LTNASESHGETTPAIQIWERRLDCYLLDASNRRIVADYADFHKWIRKNPCYLWFRVLR
jgi:hypothetical protein